MVNSSRCIIPFPQALYVIPPQMNIVRGVVDKMFEHNPKGRWLCKGSAIQYQYILFLRINNTGEVKGYTFCASKLEF